MRFLLPLAASASLSGLGHDGDDRVGGNIRILSGEDADGRCHVLVDANVTSTFWENPSVADYDSLLIAASMRDVDALVLALFEMLGAQIRRFGTDHVSCCYPDFRDFLADHLPPAVAARLDAALCRAMPPLKGGGTISFSA